MHDQLKSTTVTEAEQALMAKLLVVDDEKNIRVNLAKFLESCGHQVESAESGPQALAILAGLLPAWLKARAHKLEQADSTLARTGKSPFLVT